MRLEQQEIERGTHLLLEHLETLIADNPELSDIHDAFESFCMKKYSIGDPTPCRTRGKNQCGIDFYSINNATYHIGQCKIPQRDWLEAHPERIRTFGSDAVSDCRDALHHLLGLSTMKANENVQYLYGQIQTDKERQDFTLVFFLLVLGRLKDRAREDFEELKKTVASPNVRLVLQEIDDVVDDFLVGSDHSSDRIEIRLRKEKNSSLNAPDYCYFLANAGDIFKAFQQYGWRLFDLNLRYEIRNSSVNGDIVNSLKFHQTRKKFHHYNNGLIIVCQLYTIRDEDIRITNAQIINGLQTVKSIYNAVTTKEVSLSDLEKDCWVQVKVIRNEQPAFVNEVVRATNNQNPMAPRNLKSNAREQKRLRCEFCSVEPKWFFQVKQDEWESLTQEGGRFFKAVAGHPQCDFKPDPHRKRGRVLDNQDAAKAWLAFIGFSDWAGDRTTHYFGKEDVYDVAFRKCPTPDHWQALAEKTNFHQFRIANLEGRQPTAYQYLLAYMTWEFVRRYIPSPMEYREQGLQEGVRQGEISKASGSITSTAKQQEDYLAQNHIYQTWRLMANMKEVLVEAVSFILARKYKDLNEKVCRALLSNFDTNQFVATGDIKDVASQAVSATDLPPEAVFARILGFLRFVAGQYWEDKRNQILSTSRIRTLLLRSDMVADFKTKILEIHPRVTLDKPWKPSGTTFIDSPPQKNLWVNLGSGRSPSV